MQIIKRPAWIGIVLILSTGIIHMSMFGEEFEEAPYLGIMFLGAFIGSIIAAVGIYRRKLLWGWGMGALIALGSIIGYLLSRTVGLPISGIEPWGPATGYLSLVLENLFIMLFTRLPEFQKLAGDVTQRLQSHLPDASLARQQKALPAGHHRPLGRSRHSRHPVSSPMNLHGRP